jgi:hypothetical protein
MSTDQTCPVRDELHQAHTEFRQAAGAFADHVFGAGTRDHLRNAARHALKAGLAALDKDEQRAKPPTP